MKIAMIGHKRVPSREGGVEIVVEELSIRMAAQGHDVDIYNRWEKGKKVCSFAKKIDNINIINIPTFRSAKLNALIYSIFASIRVSFGKYDVIHYHAEGPSAMIWLPKLFGARVINTNHGLDWQRAKWGGFAKRYLLFGEKMSAKYSDELIVLSKGIQSYFEETYHRTSHLIPNGINEPIKLEPNIINKWNLKKNNYFLFLARLVPEKGAHYLIEAFRNIETDKILVIAGNSDNSDYLARLKLLCGDDFNKKIVFIGFVEGNVVSELYSNAYLYILPSDIEGLPISLLEALSFECPIIASDIDENKDVLKEFGSYFSKSDVSDLRKMLLSALEPGFRQREREFEMKKYVLARYNWDSIVRDTLALYKC